MKNQKQTLLILCLLFTSGFLLQACGLFHKTASGTKNYPAFFKIGHRGTRGLMPENTIPAMEKGIEVGANTIEFDVHLTKDGKVIVYHDDSFNPDYTLMPDGSEIPKQDRKKYTFYQMNYDQIKQFIIGTKDYPAFPQQKKMACYTPLLSELIDSVENFTQANHMADVYYLLEIKSSEKTDGFAQPAPEEFVKAIMDVLQPKHLGSRLIIQSFDMRPLQVLHREYPEIALGFLTGDKKAGFDENLSELGFNPTFYNPSYTITDEELIKNCHEQGILICPWTVEDLAEMKKLKAWGVDGIITDYPNYFSDLLK